MNGPHEDPQAAMYQMTCEVLQKLYPVLDNEDMATLLIATGVRFEDAFPWHKDERKSA